MHASKLPRAPRHKEICFAILTGFTLFGSCTGSALAQPTGQAATAAASSYDLPAGPLAVTLDAIAKQSARSVSFDRDFLVGQTAPAIRGSYTAQQAVEAALAGKKLRLVEDNKGVLNVYVVGELEQVTVLAKRDQAEKGFKADRSDTATRSGTDLMDLAGAVTIITSKVLETQQATNLRDTLRNVSGIGFTDSPQGTPQFSVRGFSNPSTTTNGIPDQNAGQTNVYNIERIEVLKGPQAILAGSGSLGGGVNVVLKKPTAEPVRDLTVQYGTNSERTIAGDVSGAISEDKRLTYRIIGSMSRSGTSDAGYNGRKDDALLPQLRWKDETTDLIVGLAYQKQHLLMPQYTFARRDGFIMPTPTVPLSNPDDGFDVTEKRAFYQLEQKLAPWATLVSRLQRTDDNLHLHQWTPGGLRYNTGAAKDDTNGTSNFFPSLQRSAQTQFSGDHYIRMQFDTGEVEHKLSVGLSHNKFDYEQIQWSGGATKLMTLYPTAVPYSFPDVDTVNTTVNSVTNAYSTQKGLYLQDLMSWGDWSLLLNWRRTLYTTSGQTDFKTSNSVFVSPETTVAKNIPGAGIVYRMSPTVSLYGNVSQGYVPQTNAACSGGIVPPILSKNKEIGAKFSLFDDKLSLTADTFRIDQSNSLAFDSVNRCFNVRPAQQTKGFEFDLQGDLAPGWRAILNYTYATTRDVTDPTVLFAAKPKHKGSLWTTYNLPQVKGLGVGLGISAASSMQGTFDKTYPFVIGKQYQVDASAFYEIPNWSFTVGVKNLTDKKLYGGTTSSSYVPVLAGRSFMLTAKHSFN